MPTTYWSPNQAAVKQARSYAFTAPSSVGNTYNASLNGKTVTYSSVSGDTATTVATALFNLLNTNTSIAAEFTEIAFANPSAGTMTATAREAGTPFAGVTVNGVGDQGLVLFTGNGLANGITTTETTPNYSPSDVFDAQNWLRVTLPAPGVRSLPQDDDDVEVRNSNVPMLWNLDRLSGVRFATYTRWQTMTGSIGLPENNPNGYKEWRATDFTFIGPAGSVPSGGLVMVLGQGDVGSGPSRERYNTLSQKTTLMVLASGQAVDEYGVRWRGVHTENSFKVLGGVSLGIAMLEGEAASLSSSTVDGDSDIGIGAGVTWTAGSTLTMYGASATMYAAPATLAMNNGAQVTIAEDELTWASITARGGSQMIWLAGGVITALVLETNSSIDKGQDLRPLTVTNSTIDGDTCFINDPNNTITWTNAASVKQQVLSGPFRFTGTRTVKVT